MSSINEVRLLGNLGQDPKVLKETEKGLFVMFSVATTKKYQDDHGKLQEITQWHTVYVNNKTGKNAVKYLKKGDRVYVSGELRKHEWQDKQGQRQFSTGVYADTIIFLNAKKTSEDLPDISEEAATVTEANLAEMDRKAA